MATISSYNKSPRELLDEHIQIGISAIAFKKENHKLKADKLAEKFNMSERTMQRYMRVANNKYKFDNLSSDEIITKNLNNLTGLMAFLSANDIQQNLSKETNTFAYIYFLKTDDNRVKIGKADDIPSRINTLKRYYNFELDESMYIKCDKQNVFKLEQWFHTFFADYNVVDPRGTDGFTEFFDVKALILLKNELFDVFANTMKTMIIEVASLKTD